MSPNRTTASRPTSGILLLVGAALAFSTAGAFTRVAAIGLWPMVFWRNGFGCLGLLILLLMRGRVGTVDPRRFSGRAWAAMAGSAFATVCYLAAFGRTSVANVSIIYATAPMIAAVLAWITLRERPRPRTLAAAAVALAGAAVTVGGSASTDATAGDGLALLMTLALSGVAVLARGSVLPPLETALGSAGLAAAAVLPIALVRSESLGVSPDQALWLALFGFVTMSVALPAYLAGASRVPAGRSMLISSVEMPFAPLWVWLAFGEMPSPAALVGGALVLGALAIDAPGQGRT